ncbi:hypothetical protein LPJ66_005713 [Kickxella alabastrina]|uniref:Uncharacterized protein n=1 Tax=Kickxella alabastrina TaxID=61397 RepID=A0ACC1IDR8_9FUNG|nr:hypothetical protein LPJ66_005713 [Kickxella alabastrina]
MPTASLLSTRSRNALLRATAASRGAAKRAKAASRGVPSHLSSDPRYETMKQLMFQDMPRTLPVLTEADMERHATILRAIDIEKSESGVVRRTEREAKFRMMEEAFEALKKLDERLFEAACVKEPNAVFPRQMRVPTETPGVRVWEY